MPQIPHLPSYTSSTPSPPSSQPQLPPQPSSTPNPCPKPPPHPQNLHSPGRSKQRGFILFQYIFIPDNPGLSIWTFIHKWFLWLFRLVNTYSMNQQHLRLAWFAAQPNTGQFKKDSEIVLCLKWHIQECSVIASGMAGPAVWAAGPWQWKGG